MTETPAPTPPALDDLLLIGTLGQPFGIRGQLKLHLITSHPEHLRQVKTIFLGPKLVPYSLKAVQPHKATIVILTLDGVVGRTAAEAFGRDEVFIRATDAAPLEEGEFFFHDLPGLKVRTLAGDEVGVVKEILETGANDVLLLERPDGSEVLIPLIKSVVRELNIAAGEIRIEPLPGLLD